MTARHLPPPKVRPGQKLRPHLTVIAALDPDSPDPVHVVWNHKALCPMACKLFLGAARARHEANIMASLAHPNIVRCLGLEAHGNKTTVLLMEYLEGESLRQFLCKGGHKRISISDAMRLAIHVCAALSHMHDRNILHLDVKPSNIIVSHGRPVLFDFGVARWKPDWKQRIFGGSDSYMPPEQIAGAPVSPASDVFSFGLTLYELLTGDLPFPSPSRNARYPQLGGNPIALRQKRRRLPESLDHLILQCLAPDPRLRPQSAAALIEPLHKLIKTGPPMWPAIVGP